MIVETTSYFAIPGQAAAVLAMRRRGVTLRRTLGLQPGRVLVRIGPDGPDVRWECSYGCREAFDRDLAVRNSSVEFSRQRAEMHALLSRFERHVFSLDQEHGP